MARVTRRKFLKVSGAGALAAKTGGMAAILATGRAPAYAQATTVHWLKWNDFVPAGDEVLRKQMLAEAEKALGFKINLETIGLNDLQPRATAAIQAKTGPDIIMIFDNKAQLYADSCADVSAVCEALGSSQGGYYDLAKANTHDGKKWIAVPYCIVGAMIAYRKSWFDEVGITKFPETWEQYREAGKKLKAKGHPLGQSLGHTVGDAPAFAYPYLWSWGGREVEADGKTVKLNTQGDDRVGQVHDRLLEGSPRRGRPCLGRLQQQPRLPVGHHQRHAERRLDLHRSAAQARPVQDREGRADEVRHPARAPAQGACRPVRLASLPVHDGDGLFEEPEAGDGVPEVVPLARGL